ncbi:MAG: hypothetical protein ACI9KE_006566 [Polyangiales bacterium]
MCKLSRVFALVLTLAAVSNTTLAQHPSSCINELTPAEVDVRIRQLDSHFQANKRRARAHWYGFMSLFAGLGVYSLVVASQADEPVDRFSNYLGGIGAFLTSAQMAVIPNTAAIAPQRFRRHADSTLEERRLKLRYGLDMMELASRRAARGSGPLAHVVPIIWSSTWSTVIMLKYDSPLTVLRMVGGGLFFSESRILLTPRDSVRSWESLRGSFCGGRYLHRYTPMEMDEMIPREDEGEFEDDFVDDYVDDYEEEADEPAPDEPETVTTGGVTLTGVYFLHTF